MEHIASLDVGTNTLRLLIAENNPDSRDFRPLLFKREITRLGEDFSKRGYLSEKAIERTIESLKTFSQLMRSYEVSRYRAVATSVVREATNGKDFLKIVNKEAGIKVDVISGEEEANLNLRGVTSALRGYQGRFIIFDIGGGSTEFILGNIDGPYEVVSTDLGVVHFTETFIQTDPPEPRELENLEAEIGKKVLSLKHSFLERWPDWQGEDCLLVGTAGTVTTLASIYLGLTTYDPALVNNLTLQRLWIEQLFHRLKEMRALDR
ncbi:MAG TPA: exopolyphosphatase, partial [Syntrophaceae bacterium]|nr:exopolyphosphatase [Syntrophaceae bacterium]